MKNKGKNNGQIERPKAVEDLDNIIEYGVGIMIAGDLGVETGLEKVPFIQISYQKNKSQSYANCEAM